MIKKLFEWYMNFSYLTKDPANEEIWKTRKFQVDENLANEGIQNTLAEARMTAISNESFKRNSFIDSTFFLDGWFRYSKLMNMTILFFYFAYLLLPSLKNPKPHSSVHEFNSYRNLKMFIIAESEKTFQMPKLMWCKIIRTQRTPRKINVFWINMEYFWRS